MSNVNFEQFKQPKAEQLVLPADNYALNIRDRNAAFSGVGIV
jgi:hypothetical protein